MTAASSRPMRGRTRIFGASLALCCALFAGPAGAISDLVVHDVYSGLAIGGYDPVAYFVQHIARLGSRTYELESKGSYWHFANEGNMAAFRQSPQVYAPAYGGYGAGAVAAGRLTPGNPLLWALYRNRLFLFYSGEERSDWLKNPDGYVRQADIRWLDLAKTLAPD